jgi:hypothetical protein
MGFSDYLDFKFINIKLLTIWIIQIEKMHAVLPDLILPTSNDSTN